MFCARCGAQNDDGVQFCASCGAPLTPMGQNPAGYGYAGQQPYYGQAPGAAPAGQMGQDPAGYGYAGQQPYYGQAPGAAPAGQMGQSPAGYGYAGQPAAYGAAPAAAKKKNIIPIIAIIAVVAVAVVAAVFFLKGRGSELVGTWAYEEYGYTMLFTFDDDGEGVISMKYDGTVVAEYDFEWEELSGKRLEMTNADGEEVVYKYSIKGDTLKLTDPDSDETMELTREDD